LSGDEVTQGGGKRVQFKNGEQQKDAKPGLDKSPAGKPSKNDGPVRWNFSAETMK